MSVDLIQGALQVALEALTPTLRTAYEGNTFKTVVDEPYQRADFIFAAPENNENTSSYRQGGFMQVTLKYPAGVGSGALIARALMIRNAFPRGLALSLGGVVTNIEHTPSIFGGPPEGSWIVRFVRVPFYANDLS